MRWRLGSTVAHLRACVTTNRHLAQIKADIARAEQIGVSSNPAFVINGRLMLGAQPYAEFARIIDVMISPP
jgi:predicted DsbA family dithiol-disulfide isomerase